jgi:hypothetical protein
VGPEKGQGGVVSTLVKLGVGGAAGALLFFSQRHISAYVVWGIAGAVGGVSLVSARAREAIDWAIGWFARALGSVLGAVLLTVVYVLVVTPTRFARRLAGADDLHLRDAERVSYWLPCDDDERKVRYVGAMFATEARTSAGHPLRAALLSLVALVLLAEGVARTKGFAHPVLYVADPDIGYYPQPSAELIRYGGRITTNKFGMRSAEVDREKPPGVFRVLMIGDSTLYGGSYVDQEDTYSTQVEKHLNGSYDGGSAPKPPAEGSSDGRSGPKPPGKVEVLAMGCNGWGPFHERGFVKKYPDAFQADLVLVHMPIDDVVRPLYGLMEVPFFAVQTPPRFALEEIFNHLVWRYRAEGSGKDEEWQAKQAQYGIREYGALVDDLRRAGSEVMLFVLPRSIPSFDKPLPQPRTDREDDPDRKMLHQLEIDEAWRAKLEATVGERSVKLQFARGFFKGKGSEEELYRDDGIHLNPKGHHVYARFIEEKIRSESARFRAWVGEASAQVDARATGNTQPAVSKQ